MIFFSDRKKIEESYKEWLKENPQVADCPFNVISFMVGKGLVKDKTETDFYERGENLKLKEKLKNWLFTDEIKRIQILETCYKDQIEWCKDRADESYRTSERARLSYQRSEKEVEECRRLITQLVDIGVDVGFHSEDHSWAVVCIAGKQEYVKFLPLETRDARDVLRFLKQFEYSRRIVDSPLAFKSMLKNEFLER